MKKITISWNILQNRAYQTTLVEVCEDDFVEITKRQMVYDATRIGVYPPPDSIIVEDYDMGVLT